MSRQTRLLEIWQPNNAHWPFSRVRRKIKESLLGPVHLKRGMGLRPAVSGVSRTYMEAVKTLVVYGWFFYPFFTLSAFMATTAVEMALKLRLQKRPDDPSSLKGLFDQAIARGLLRDDCFPSRKNGEANRTALFGENEEPSQATSAEPRPSRRQWRALTPYSARRPWAPGARHQLPFRPFRLCLAHPQSR